MKSILEMLEDKEAFTNQLKKIADSSFPDGSSCFKIFLKQLGSYVDKIPEHQIGTILEVFYDVGDEFRSSETDEFYGLDIQQQIVRVCTPLLFRLDRDARYALLMETTEHGNALEVIVDQIIIFGYQHGKHGSQEQIPDVYRLLNSTQLDQIEQRIVERVRRCAENKSFPKSHAFRRALDFWAALKTEAEVSHWFQELVASDEGLIWFLESFMDDRFDPMWLQNYIDLDEIYPRVQALQNLDTLTERQRTALKQFLEEADIREQGLDLNNPYLD